MSEQLANAPVREVCDYFTDRYWGISLPAQETALALREVLYSLGHEPSAFIDYMSEHESWFSTFVDGVITAPVDAESKGTILHAVCLALNDDPTAPTGKGYILRQVRRFEAAAFADSIKTGAIDLLENLYETRLECRRVLERLSLEQLLARTPIMKNFDVVNAYVGLQLSTYDRVRRFN